MATTSTTTNSRDLRGAIAHVGEDVREVRKDLSNLATAFGDEMKVRASKLTSVTRKRADRAAHAFTEQIRARPLAALGVAAGVGLLLGALMKLRR